MGKKPADVPFGGRYAPGSRSGVPRIADNPSSYGRTEGSREIIVREEEQTVPLIESPVAPETCCRRERTQGTFRFCI